jgi:RNA recognition motif-containing protein
LIPLFAESTKETKEKTMNIYVGNLSFEVTDDDLRQLFSAHGEVESASVVKDRFSGESRGFGFIEMPAKKDADAAIAGLNGTDVKGRTITVNEAKPKAPKSSGGGGGGGGGRGGRRY